MASAVAIVALAGLIIPAGAAAAGSAATLTAARLRADLIAGANTTAVPSALQPPLQTAPQAIPGISKNGCQLQHPGIRSKPCIYGDRGSTTSVVLFGDSHAAAWFPALNLVSKQQHWRLVDLTKAGCPPVEVNIRLHGVTPYRNCAAWRRNAEAQIAALHPALVIVTWARFIELPEARPLAGVPSGYGSLWQDGLAAIFAFLHSEAGRVIFISDTPTLAVRAPECAWGHPSDVFPCTITPGDAVLFPAVKREELQLARREQIQTIDPISWFCAPTRCPVIVGNILLYRDNSHMTPAWSRFIAPVLGAAITRLTGV